MVNNSYICGAEQNNIINTDLGGVPWLHTYGVFCFCKNYKGASLSLYILTKLT